MEKQPVPFSRKPYPVPQQKNASGGFHGCQRPQGHGSHQRDERALRGPRLPAPLPVGRGSVRAALGRRPLDRPPRRRLHALHGLHRHDAGRLALARGRGAAPAHRRPAAHHHHRAPPGRARPLCGGQPEASSRLLLRRDPHERLPHQRVPHRRRPLQAHALQGRPQDLRLADRQPRGPDRSRRVRTFSPRREPRVLRAPHRRPRRRGLRLDRAPQARGRLDRPRPGQGRPAAHLRVHELHGQGPRPRRPRAQLRAHGLPHAPAGAGLRDVLAHT